MGLFDWFSSQFTDRGKSMTVYSRGVAKAKKKDHAGAIEDYTATIDMRDTPGDLRARALFGRALVYVSIGDDRRGSADLSMVLGMGDADVNLKTMVRQKLARMEFKSREKNS